MKRFCDYGKNILATIAGRADELKRRMYSMMIWLFDRFWISILHCLALSLTHSFWFKILHKILECLFSSGLCWNNVFSMLFVTLFLISIQLLHIVYEDISYPTILSLKILCQFCFVVLADVAAIWLLFTNFITV